MSESNVVACLRNLPLRRLSSRTYLDWDRARDGIARDIEI